MPPRPRISSPLGRLLRVALLLPGVMLLCAASSPAFAAGYTVRPGDTIQTVAARFKTTPRLLAGRNGLKPNAPLNAGAVLTVPDAKASAKPGAKASALAGGKASDTKALPASGSNKSLVNAAPLGKPRGATKPASILDTRVLLDSPMSASSKGLNAPTLAPERPEKFAITPVMRPAVDLLSPKEAVERAPKEFNAAAPGLKATLRTGRTDEDIRITGVVNAPGQGSSKSLPILERDAPSGTSAGVLLQKSF